MLTLTARTLVSTWPESLRSARLWPKNPPVNSMTTITEDIASAIQRRRSALLDGTVRSMSNVWTVKRSENRSIRNGRKSFQTSARRDELSDNFRASLVCVVGFHELEW